MLLWPYTLAKLNHSCSSIPEQYTREDSGSITLEREDFKNCKLTPPRPISTCIIVSEAQLHFTGTNLLQSGACLCGR